MRRLGLLAALIYILALLALASFVGSLLVLAVPLLLLVGAGLIYGPDDLQLSITRSLNDDRARENAPVEVTLTIINEGSRLEEILVEDSVPGDLQVLDGNTSVLTSLDPGESVAITYTVQGMRGYYDFNHVRVTARDFFDLFRRQANLTASGRNGIYVLPHVIRLRRITIRPRSTRLR